MLKIHEKMHFFDFDVCFAHFKAKQVFQVHHPFKKGLLCGLEWLEGGGVFVILNQTYYEEVQLPLILLQDL